MTNSVPKFKVGQVVIWERGGRKAPMSFIVNHRYQPLDDTEWFYQIDRKNALAEHMLRALTAKEKGDD